MKIFTATQIRAWDKCTIKKEGISSIELMDRAATASFEWIKQNIPLTKHFHIFCGTGNNGGDGLVIARLLKMAQAEVIVFILDNKKHSSDFNINLLRLSDLQIEMIYFKAEKDFPTIDEDAVIIDALFGTGLDRPLKSIAAALVNYINQTHVPVISIDMPSGLAADGTLQGGSIIKATNTLSFEVNKLAFFLPENAVYTGAIQIISIGLNKNFYDETASNFETIDEHLIAKIYIRRNAFAHKYNFGHALIYAGSKNMMGAAILCSKACLRSGAGLVTIQVSRDCEGIINVAIPEAITSSTSKKENSWLKKAAIGIGPGMEINSSNKLLLKKILTDWDGPLVIDASALQLLITLSNLLPTRKNHPAILTPHQGEFEKLFGKTISDLETLQLATKKSAELNCFIILKGHNTLISCPDGHHYFNTTGNAGMATAGSGDALTGLLTGLLAQGYTEKNACILGVYLHGLAGDIAAEKMSQEAMIASDITVNLGEAFKQIKGFASVKFNKI